MFRRIAALLPVVAAVLILNIILNAGDAVADSLARVQPDLKPLDLSRAPTVEELMAAGQLGGQLYPTSDIVVDDPRFPRHAAKAMGAGSKGLSAPDRHRQINLSFGTAIQEWNRHNYVEAVVLFKKHVADFSDSPWVSEALLHLGCDAFYHGRSTEAEAYFNDIIGRNRNNRHEGAMIMTNKARLRLAVLKAARNNTKEAIELFALLAKESSDWRDRTYATQWLQRLSKMKNAGTAPLACGAQALSRFLEVSGLDDGKTGLDLLRPKNSRGFSFEELARIAAERGVQLAALRLKPEDLPQLELPVLVHLSGHLPGDSGHYWVLEEMNDGRLTLFDPQGERYYSQTFAEFAREWSGAVLVNEDADTPLPGVRLVGLEMEEIAGGCCGVPKPESDLGKKIKQGAEFLSNWFTGVFAPMPPVIGELAPLLSEEGAAAERGGMDALKEMKAREALRDRGDYDEYLRVKNMPMDQFCTEFGCGAPTWFVNPVNMNLFVQDTPLWYRPAVGLPVQITLSYNSQSAIAQHEPFGPKWQFNYGSSLVVDTGGEVTIFMADGRRDVYSPNPAGGYLHPYQVYNTLVKLAENRFELLFPDGRVYLYAIPSGTSSLQPFLTESRDAYGNKLSFTYDSQIHLTTITDALGGVTTLTYNGNGLITRATDPFGRHADFEYSPSGALNKITDMGGYSFSFTYDSTFYLTSIGNTLGTSEFYIEPAEGINNSADSYPPPGGVMWENYRITVTNPQGGREEFYYNGYTGSSWHIQPRDYVSYYPGYDGYTTPKTSVNFGTTTGQRAEISSVTTPAGHNYSYVYDVNGDLLTNWEGSRYIYNDKGMVTAITDPRLNLTNRSYAPNGVDLLTETNGLGTVTYAYNANHGVTSVTDRLNHSTTHVYNSLGQLTSSTDPLGAVKSYEYDVNHRLARTSIAGVTIGSFTHDSFGRVRTYTNSAGVTLTYDYNLLDDVTRVTYPDSTFVVITYSTAIPRLVEAVTDRAGKTTSYSYDTLNRLTGLVRPDGSAFSYVRDANGNLTAATDPNGNTTRIKYDLDNRPIQETYPDGTILNRTFRSAGLLETITQADGRWFQLQFDEMFNLTSMTGGTLNGASHVYDAYNRRISMTDSRGETSYNYDAASRLTSVIGPAGSGTITLTYDNAGRRTGLEIDGRTITYAYDALGRVTGVTEAGKSHVFGYAGANPLPGSITRPSGSITTVLRDSLNRPQQVDNKKSNSSLINRFAYTYAPGRKLPASETVTGGATPPVVPSALQIYGYDSMNQPLSGTSPDRTYTWDQNGNLITGYAADGSIFTATYDELNRLMTLEFTDTGGVARRTEYVYDGDGRLAAATESADSVPVREAKFVRLGPLLLQERDGTGAVVRDYTWSGSAGRGSTLLGIRQGGADYEYLFDGRGRVAALIDGTQTVAAAYSYDPFGAPYSSGSFKQPFRSSFSEFDERAGLYQFSSRFFLPNPGAMISRQVTTQPGGLPAGNHFRPLRLLEMRPTAALQGSLP